MANGLGLSKMGKKRILNFDPHKGNYFFDAIIENMQNLAFHRYAFPDKNIIDISIPGMEIRLAPIKEKKMYIHIVT